MKVMIIDDEEQMRHLVGTILTREGYEVIAQKDGMEALQSLETCQPDMMLVDIMMPYMDGFTFLEEVRKTLSIPAIFLTARGESVDVVKGLKAGGDDYIVKPFHADELIARMENVIRRVYNRSQQSHQQFGPLSIHKSTHFASLHGNELKLTNKEFDLLVLLAENSHRYYSRDTLLALLWGETYLGSERTVDTHIKTLRLKLGECSDLIKTVWGKGYRFEV